MMFDKEGNRYSDVHNRKVVRLLEAIGACFPARDFVTQMSGVKKAWNECQNADWMLWLLSRITSAKKRNSRGHRKIFLCIAEMVELAVPAFEDEFDQANIQGLANDLRLYGVGKIKVEDIELPQDIDFCGSFFYLLRGLIDGFGDMDDAWLAADYMMSIIAYHDNGDRYGDYYSDKRRAANRKLADIVRQYYPEPPTL